MSEVFHKSCYTSRSSGYKYRTLSTNTGQKKRRDSHEDNTFDMKFRDLQRAITTRVDKEMYLTQQARETIEDKFSKIDAKVSSLLELQNTVTTLRKDLQVVENCLAGMLNKVEMIETVMADSEGCSLNSRKSSSLRSPQLTIYEEKEFLDSNIKYV